MMKKNDFTLFAKWSTRIKTLRKKLGSSDEKNIGPKESTWHFGIRLRLIFSFMIPVLFIIVLGIVSYDKASQAIISSYRSSSRQAVEMTAKYLSFGLNSISETAFQYINDNNFQEYTSGYYRNDVISQASNKSNISKSLMAKRVSDPFISNIHIVSENSGLLSTSMSSSDTSLYTVNLNTKSGSALKDNASGSYWVGLDSQMDEKLSVNHKDYAVRYVMGFPNSNSCIMVDVSASEIKSILKELDFSKGSKVGFVTGDGRELLQSGKNEDTIFTQQDFYQDSMSDKQASISLDVRWSGQNYLYISAPLGKSGARICALIPENVITKQVRGIKGITLLLVILACIIAVLTGAGMASSIQRAIQHIIRELKKVSDGNLTIKLKVKRKDEFLALADGINDMISNMRGLIEKVKLQSGSVTESSVKVSNSSEIFSNATKEITDSVNEIQEGVSQQAADAQSCLQQMDDLSRKIEEVSGKTNEISNIAMETKQSISQGMYTIQVLNEKAKSTNVITSRIISNIRELADESMSISNIVSTINGFAGQTNLLSLNASIEAAKAGEYGRGFSVVADEIRNLADQSVRAVKEIKELINETQIKTKEAENIVREAENVVRDQGTAVGNTEKSFHDMNSHVERLVGNVTMIIENINNIETAKAKTLTAIENISAVSQETAAASSNVSETADHQLDAVESLNGLSKELDENAKSLETMIHQFKVE